MIAAFGLNLNDLWICEENRGLGFSRTTPRYRKFCIENERTLMGTRKYPPGYLISRVIIQYRKYIAVKNSRTVFVWRKLTIGD